MQSLLRAAGSGRLALPRHGPNSEVAEISTLTTLISDEVDPGSSEDWWDNFGNEGRFPWSGWSIRRVG